ncbi:hypothetical protein EN784_03905 [bacterium M00.F.Ca.ET.141.01.1.1]|nr:hypothetical protein EN784_03905 [bacterium M00.F.Ca.ET.141.01.1.1]
MTNQPTAAGTPPHDQNGTTTAALAAMELGRELIDDGLLAAEIAAAFAIASVVFGNGQVSLTEG